MMNVLIFDIETVPDVEGGRRLHQLADLSDAEVAEAMFALRRQETAGSEFLSLPLQRIVAISLVLKTMQGVKIWSLGEPNSPEAELITRFFAGIDRYTPTLVSWNGGGFDLPVLHYRALVHSISAPRYFETGNQDTAFRYNNYLSRYHSRHMDLMDILAAYQPRATTSLDKMATLLGFPGKMGMAGGKVWEKFQQEGGIHEIRDYCETDVLNTYLIYLRFELLRGIFTPHDYQKACDELRETLAADERPHLQQFLNAWQQNDTLFKTNS